MASEPKLDWQKYEKRRSAALASPVTRAFLGILDHKGFEHYVAELFQRRFGGTFRVNGGFDDGCVDVEGRYRDAADNAVRLLIQCKRYSWAEANGRKWEVNKEEAASFYGQTVDGRTSGEAERVRLAYATTSAFNPHAAKFLGEKNVWMMDGAHLDEADREFPLLDFFERHRGTDVPNFFKEFPFDWTEYLNATGRSAPASWEEALGKQQVGGTESGHGETGHGEAGHKEFENAAAKHSHEETPIAFPGWAKFAAAGAVLVLAGLRTYYATEGNSYAPNRNAENYSDFVPGGG